MQEVSLRAGPVTPDKPGECRDPLIQDSHESLLTSRGIRKAKQRHCGESALCKAEWRRPCHRTSPHDHLWPRQGKPCGGGLPSVLGARGAASELTLRVLVLRRCQEGGARLRGHWGDATPGSPVCSWSGPRGSPHSPAHSLPARSTSCRVAGTCPRGPGATCPSPCPRVLGGTGGLCLLPVAGDRGPGRQGSVDAD